MSNSRSPRAVRSMTMGMRGMSPAYPAIGINRRSPGHRALGNDHRRALKAALAQVGEGPLGVLERVRGNGRADRDLRGQGQELLPVLTSEVGHRADSALQPEVLIGEGRNVAHVNARA